MPDFRLIQCDNAFAHDRHIWAWWSQGEPRAAECMGVPREVRPCGQTRPHQPHEWYGRMRPDAWGHSLMDCPGVAKRHKHKLVLHRRTMYTMIFACVPRTPEEPGYEPDWACNYTTRYDRGWVKALIKGETQLGELAWLAEQEKVRAETFKNLGYSLGIRPRQSDYSAQFGGINLSSWPFTGDE